MHAPLIDAAMVLCARADGKRSVLGACFYLYYRCCKRVKSELGFAGLRVGVAEAGLKPAPTGWLARGVNGSAMDVHLAIGFGFLTHGCWSGSVVAIIRIAGSLSRNPITLQLLERWADVQSFRWLGMPVDQPAGFFE